MGVKILIKDIPPSNNKYMGNSHNYNVYRLEKKRWFNLIAAAAFNGGAIPKEPYNKVVIKIDYYFKNRVRRDPDNYSGKFLLDPLVKLKIIKDDSFNHIERIEVRGLYDKNNPRTEIEVIELEGVNDDSK